MGGADNEACEAGRRERCVNLIQQGSAVPYNWFLPVISEFEFIQFSIGRRNIRQCAETYAPREQSSLGRVQARYKIKD